MTLTQFEEEAGTRERLLIEWQEARPSRGVWPVSCPAFDSASYQPTAACRQRRRQWATDKRTRSMGQALANFQSYPLTIFRGGMDGELILSSNPEWRDKPTQKMASECFVQRANKKKNLFRFRKFTPPHGIFVCCINRFVPFEKWPKKVGVKQNTHDSRALKKSRDSDSNNNWYKYAYLYLYLCV